MRNTTSFICRTKQAGSCSSPAASPPEICCKWCTRCCALDLRAALFSAAQSQTQADAFQVPMDLNGDRRVVDIHVFPAADLAPEHLLIKFDSHPLTPGLIADRTRTSESDQVSHQLERELERTKAQLRDTVEQSEASTEELKASNEELQAMNEELRSATEELETSREELQSINEELATVNLELKNKVDELGHSNSDLHVLMAATAIATIFLDRDLRIVRYTPPAVDLFNLIPTDIGRPLSDLTHRLDYPDMERDARRALGELLPVRARSASCRPLVPCAHAAVSNRG